MFYLVFIETKLSAAGYLYVLIFCEAIIKICLLAFISVKLQLNVIGFMDTLHLRKLSTGEANSSFDTIHLFFKRLTRNIWIINPSYLSWGLKGRSYEAIRYHGNDWDWKAHRRNFCAKNRPCDVLTEYFLGGGTRRTKRNQILFL